MARAIRFGEHGGTDVLSFVEVPDPEPGPGQVRLAVRAAGVNPFDWKVLHGFVPGLPKAFPAGLGNDVAGVVDALGEGVEAVAVGDPVLASRRPRRTRRRRSRRRTGWSRSPTRCRGRSRPGSAGAGGVAWKVLERLGVGAGDTLLVHAAAGGVGTFAVQLGVARGARVIGTASEANHDLLRGWGAIPVRYGDGLAERVREVAPDGIDTALDASGRGGELPVSVELAGGPERVLTIARFDDVPEGVTIHGGGSMGDLQPALREIIALIGEGRLEVPIGGTYPLEDAAAALDASEHGHLAGKIVLITSGRRRSRSAERRVRAGGERQGEDVARVARVDHAVVPQPRGRVVRAALVLVLLAQPRADLGLADLVHHRRRLLAAHDADARVRPHEQEARRVRAAAHAVVAGAERAADDHRQLRHARAARPR